MRKVALLILSIAGVVTLVAAQAPPTLEGTWYIDKAHSRYTAESVTEVIQQSGNAMDIRLTETSLGHPNTPVQLHLRTDGKPTINTVGANKFTSTTHWEHDKLVTFVEGERWGRLTVSQRLSSISGRAQRGSSVTFSFHGPEKFTAWAAAVAATRSIKGIVFTPSRIATSLNEVKCVGVRCAQNRIDLREHAAFTNRVLLAGGPGGGRNGRYRTPMNRRGLTLRTIPSE